MKTFLNIVAASLIVASTATAFDQTHTSWDKLVTDHVKPTGVDYSSFKKEQSSLKSCLLYTSDAADE